MSLRHLSGCWGICSLALGVDTTTLLTGRGGYVLIRPRVPLGLYEENGKFGAAEEYVLFHNRL
jgi:hypothetical protein